MNKNFTANTAYSTRSVCDYNCVFNFFVVKRTAKTVTLSNDERTDMDAKGKTFRIREWEGVEQFKPFGSYSMAPIVTAEKVAS